MCHILQRYDVNSKGLEIFLKSWLPEPGIQIKGALFFCHGYGDTCTFFFEGLLLRLTKKIIFIVELYHQFSLSHLFSGIAKMIAHKGYAVYAMDYPGFGLSEGLHGYIPNFDELVEHVIEQYTRIKGVKVTYLRSLCDICIKYNQQSPAFRTENCGVFCHHHRNISHF